MQDLTLRLRRSLRSACMRKLLVILNTMAKTNEPWRYAQSAQVAK